VTRFAAGVSSQLILADYSLPEAEDIAAALEYAARQSDHLGMMPRAA